MTIFRSALRSQARSLFLIASTALICTAGTAFAAAQITGAQVKDGSIASKDVKNSTIVSTDVRNGSLQAADLSAAARTALKGNAGPKGADGVVGAQGLPGAAGAAGQRGASSWDEIPSGQTVVGSFYELRANNVAGLNAISINLPGKMNKQVGAGNINFAPSAVASDDDATCTGTASAPTAPAGLICIYPGTTTGVVAGTAEGKNDSLLRHGFRIFWESAASDQAFSGSWAYTAL